MQKKIIEIIESKSGSKTFCVLPWIHFATRPNGDMRLCCTANASGAGEDHHVGLVKDDTGSVINLAKTRPLAAWNSESMKQTRLDMLAGRVPKSCTKCFEEERNGVVSKRLWETYSWSKEGTDIAGLINETEVDGTVPDRITYLDLRLGHTCNLKCVMCSPHDSSRWVQDHEKLLKRVTIPVIKEEIGWDSDAFDNTWYEKPGFWEDLNSQIPNLREVYFAGGEPLMIKEHKNFLLEIIKLGHAKNVYLRYNSNGLLIDSDIIDIWNQFKRVKFNFSIDAVDQRNNYIRYPSDWAAIERNLDILDNTNDHIEVNIACAVQLLNIKHLPDMIKWKLSKNYRKINKGREFDIESGGGLINTHLVYIPTWFDIRALPAEDKKEVRESFGRLANWLEVNYRQDQDFWKNNPYGWKRLQSLVTFMDSADHSHRLPALRDYIKNLDNIRLTNFAEIFPELAHLIL